MVEKKVGSTFLLFLLIPRGFCSVLMWSLCRTLLVVTTEPACSRQHTEVLFFQKASPCRLSKLKTPCYSQLSPSDGLSTVKGLLTFPRADSIWTPNIYEYCWLCKVTSKNISESERWSTAFTSCDDGILLAFCLCHFWLELSARAFWVTESTSAM